MAQRLRIDFASNEPCPQYGRHYLDRGEFGDVYLISPTVVEKIINFDDPESNNEMTLARINSFYREAQYSSLVAPYGISPRLLKYYICQNRGHLLFDRIESNLHEYGEKTLKRKVPSRFTSRKQMEYNHLIQVLQICCLLDKLGIYHNDLHDNNFMFDKDGKIYLIDWGVAGQVEARYEHTKWHNLINFMTNADKMVIHRDGYLFELDLLPSTILPYHISLYHMLSVGSFEPPTLPKVTIDPNDVEVYLSSFGYHLDLHEPINPMRSLDILSINHEAVSVFAYTATRTFIDLAKDNYRRVYTTILSHMVDREDASDDDSDEDEVLILPDKTPTQYNEIIDNSLNINMIVAFIKQIVQVSKFEYMHGHLLVLLLISLQAVYLAAQHNIEVPTSIFFSKFNVDIRSMDRFQYITFRQLLEHPMSSFIKNMYDGLYG